MSKAVPTLKNATDADFIAEFARRASTLPPALKDQASAVLAESSRLQVEKALSGAGEAAREDPRLSPYKS